MRETPIDKLPVEMPVKCSGDPSQFYHNVVRHLVPDIIKLKYTGIPIDLDRVVDIENTINDVLDNVENEINNNPLMQEFIRDKTLYVKKQDTDNIKNKMRSQDSFKKVFNPKNKIHVSYVVNTFLKDHGYSNLIAETWTKTSIKKLNETIHSIFLRELVEDVDSFIRHYSLLVDKAMNALAYDKMVIYNKNKEAKLIDSIKNKPDEKFNIGSTKQKAEFFRWLGIESDTKTDKGADQWNRDALEKLNKLLDEYLENDNDTD